MDEQPPLLNPKPYKVSKTKIYFWLAILVIGFTAGVVLWIRNLYSENAAAEKVLTTYQQVQNEVSRCQQLMAQTAGEFDQYEYCKKLLETFSSR